MLNVSCVSYRKLTVSSISSRLQPTPHVTVVADDQTFVIYADRITLNGEQHADLESGTTEVRIEISEDGFEIEADGNSITTSRPAS